MNDSLAIDEWLTHFETAIVEVGASALGFSNVTLHNRASEVPESLSGAYLSLTAESDAVQIGLTTTEVGCQYLAKALLGMDPSDPDLPMNDVADAVCEIVNISAGLIKRKIFAKALGLTIGLPLFVRGGVQTTDKLLGIASEVRLGTMTASVLVLQPGGWRSEPLPPLRRSSHRA